MTTLSAMPYLDDLLYGVSAGLQHEFPEIAPDKVASSVEAARAPELGLLPDLPAYASAVASRARNVLAADAPAQKGPSDHEQHHHRTH